ncbi:MAG: hypothetical protein H8E93_00390 [Synechococcus sp.]|nr:hypothetical protein [Synechococcus sp.]
MSISPVKTFRPVLNSNGLTVLAVLVLTAMTDWRLIDSGLSDHLFDFGDEALNAVRAWDDHGFWSMAGLFPWGGYIPPETTPTAIYQSKTPVHLLHLWAAFKLVGLEGFTNFKLVYSLMVVSLNGVLLGCIAKLCFPLRGPHWVSPIPGNLVFLSTYAITISNEAMLRFCLVDEPDYLGMTFWLATIVALGHWLKRYDPKETNERDNNYTEQDQASTGISQLKNPKVAIGLGFMSSWIYPILGVINLIALFLLQLFPVTKPLQKGIRALMPGALAGIALYWIHRVIAKQIIPEKLIGSELMYRMGLTTNIEGHDGIFDAIDFLYDQRSGGIPSFLRNSQIRIEHIAIWILGFNLFFIVFAKLKGINRQSLLVLSAGSSWLFVPLLTQSLAMHGWVYGIHFMPSVVLGWVGGCTTVFPGRQSQVFGPGTLGFCALLIWVIQMRWFLVAYLS